MLFGCASWLYQLRVQHSSMCGAQVTRVECACMQTYMRAVAYASSPARLLKNDSCANLSNSGDPAAAAAAAAALVCRCRLITSDAFAAVRRSYLLRQLARQPLHDEEQQQG